jgi:hypothetical protein
MKSELTMRLFPCPGLLLPGFLCALLFVTGCSGSNPKPNGEPNNIHLIVDSVSHHKDPKGGLFGSWLTTVFHDERDQAMVFCGWERNFSPGKTQITVFYDDEVSTSEHSACLQSFGIYQGDFLWNDGDPKSKEQLFQDAKTKLESQRAFVTGLIIANIPRNRNSGNMLVLRIEDSGPDISHHISMGVISPDGTLSKSFPLCEPWPSIEKGQHVRIDYVMRFATPEMFCMGITKVTPLGDDLSQEIVDATKRKDITDIGTSDATTIPLDLYRGKLPIKIRFGSVNPEDCGSGGCNFTIIATESDPKTDSNGRARTISSRLLNEFGEIFPTSEFTGNYRNLVTAGGGNILLWKLYEDPAATRMSGASYQATDCFTRDEDQVVHRNICMPSPSGITTVK